MAGVDFHNHLMPGVDDGAQTIEETVEGLEAFRTDGVGVVVATPHVDASLTLRPDEFSDRMAELDRAYVDLQRCARDLGSIRVDRGVELLLDVPEPNLEDPRIRLGGGKYFLTEFPFFMVPPQSVRVVRAIADAGYTPIIAHPERYNGFGNDIDIAAQWKQAGALLQVNGGSLLGRYGAEPRAIAFDLLERGWIDFLCSDYHTRGPTLVADYRDLLESMDAAEQAHTLMETNPTRMLEGLAPLPVASIRNKRTIWTRMTGIFKP
ncbi:MAG TPA: CpsB/CapC family capsule biosynthesis tyrosine phosphatase [Longimicrobiales bacterium]|nr:CpsB/CapC family capsule biosynthesis tyrosine phosphatase [Longimicrobiales bacterium]